jgi:parvulin-like peptidyl-prolyl isomerase
VGKTGPIQQNTKVQLGNIVVPDAGVWAFQAKRGSTSPVIETTVAFYVFRLDSLRPEGVPPFTEIKSAVAYTAGMERKDQLGKKVAEDYINRLDSGSTMAEAASAMKLAHQEFGPFSRVNPPLTDARVVGTAFGLEAGQRSGILDTKSGLYVLKVLEHTKADSSQFVKDLDQYRAKTISAARQARVRGYLDALRQAAKVKDDRSKVLQTVPAQQGA